MTLALPSAPAKAIDAVLHGSSNSSNPNIILLDYRYQQTFSALRHHGLESEKLTIGTPNQPSARS
jgi:hypothetical protein